MSLQRYTKALTRLQRSSLVQSSRKKPSERKLVLSSVSADPWTIVSMLDNSFDIYHCQQALQRINYNSDGMLKKCGISIGPEFAQVDGRILPPPKVG